MADALSKMSDDELEKEGFRLGKERAEAEKHWRNLQLAQQAEVTRRSDAREGAAPGAGQSDAPTQGIEG